jgi:hypothetical protein
MSLGWQCESAILPSKAKPIKIDSTSILGLKALVYSEEQKRSNSSTANNRHLGAHRSKTLNLAFTDRFEGNKTKSINSVQNVRNNDEAEDKEARVLSSLTAKSKLYDEIKNGSLNGVSSVLFDSEFNSVTPPPDYCLQPNINDNDDTLDEYGRIKPPQYQWSTGHKSSNDTYKHDKTLERDFNRVLEERLREQATQKTSTNNFKDETPATGSRAPTYSIPVSSAARVKTQWEKTLQSSARGYLDEVHRDAQAERGLQAADNNTESSGVVGKKRSAREERLDMLRAKQQRVVQGAAGQ